MPLLTFWTPGAGVDDFPKGTGVPLPAGSLVVMQVHYTLLLGDKPVKNSLVLDTVPESAPLLPLHLDLMLAPPDIPCPAGVGGPLCNRTASLANLGQRFGQSAVDEVNGIEGLCGNNPADPPEGDSTSCTSQIEKSGYIVRVYAHMHLLGRSFKMVLNPGTPQAKTVLDVPNFDFHDQKSYNLSNPIPVTAGEPVQVTCSYDPTLAQELPILRERATPFRHLGGRVDGRDVHRTRVDVGRSPEPTRQPLTARHGMSAAGSVAHFCRASGRQSGLDGRSSDQKRMACSTWAKARVSIGMFPGLNHRISAVSSLVRASSGRTAWPTK